MFRVVGYHIGECATNVTFIVLAYPRVLIVHSDQAFTKSIIDVFRLDGVQAHEIVQRHCARDAVQSDKLRIAHSRS